MVSVATIGLLSASVYLQHASLAWYNWIAEQPDLRGLYFPLEKDTDRHLNNRLGLGCFIPVDFVNANVVFAIPAGLDFGRHIG